MPALATVIDFRRDLGGDHTVCAWWCHQAEKISPIEALCHASEFRIARCYKPTRSNQAKHPPHPRNTGENRRARKDVRSTSCIDECMPTIQRHAQSLEWDSHTPTTSPPSRLPPSACAVRQTACPPSH